MGGGIQVGFGKKKLEGRPWDQRRERYGEGGWGGKREVPIFGVKGDEDPGKY